MGNHVSGTIKPLEWVSDPDNDGSDWFHRAWSGECYYEVGQDHNGWWWQEYNVSIDPAKYGYSSLEAAKSAAQADYEARVLGQIEPDTEAQPVVSCEAKQVNYIKIASEGFEIWKAKSHNKKWFRRIDGTPIPNDLIVCIAGAFAAHQLTESDPQAALSDTDAPQAAPSSEAGELLPCPFCGGTNLYNATPSNAADCGVIACRSCGAEGPDAGSVYAIAWNRRALTAARADGYHND